MVPEKYIIKNEEKFNYKWQQPLCPEHKLFAIVKIGNVDIYLYQAVESSVNHILRLC